MAWIEVHQALRGHRKTLALRRQLGMENDAQAIGHLVCLWLWTLDNAPDGDLSEMDDATIAYGADFPEERAKEFVKALQKARFLDDKRIHNWEEYAGRLMAIRESNRERARKARERKRAKGGQKAEPKEPEEEDAPEGVRESYANGMRDVPVTCANRTRDVRVTCANGARSVREACGATKPNRTQRNPTVPNQTKQNITLPNPTTQDTTVPDTTAPNTTVPGARARAERQRETEWFEQFWQLYPRKGDRHMSEILFRGEAFTEEEFLEMMDALRYWMQTHKWRVFDGRYAPVSMQWLRQRMWREPRPERTEAPEEEPWTEDGHAEEL